MIFALKRILKNGKIRTNVDMRKHTSFKIGGKARFFVQPSSVEELLDLIWYLNRKKKKYYVLGNGTNIVFSDKKYNGVIVSLLGLNEIRKYDDYIQVFAGVSINRLCHFFKENNLSGIEDAFGIPGTIGGAVVMNAGAYNFETQNIVIGVLVLKNGKVDYIYKDDCEFGYRSSGLKDSIVISVDIKYGEGCNIERMNEVMAMRKQNQPLNMPSAGSVFKRVEGVIVSKLLDDMGFKGKRVGDAVVSEKHAGFIVNNGKATYSDVKLLVNEIKSSVKAEKDIDLETEIQFVE